MKKSIILGASLILLSCAKSSGIVEASKEPSYFEGASFDGEYTFVNSETFPNQKHYRIFEQGSDGLAPLSELRAKANYSARFFCSNKKGKPRVVTISEMTSKPPHVLGNFPRYELVFACIQQKEEPLYIENTSGNTSHKDKYKQLKLLKELLDSGAITESKFNIEKAKLLGG